MSSAIFAWIYVLVFLRFIRVIRTSQTFGPLLISLVKMMVDLIQFFVIFFCFLCSFALGLTEIFWHYGMCEHEHLLFCHFENLFWSLFGYFELYDITLTDRIVVEYWDRILLLAFYHVFAIIVLINMVIAMMALSFEVTSENRDVEWKFHRTVLWISFVQREITRPPPLNLIPNFYFLYSVMRDFVRWLAANVCRCDLTSFWRRKESLSQNESLKRQLKDLEQESFYIRSNIRKHLSKQIEIALAERYKFKNLLKGTIHHHQHWQRRNYKNW